MEYVDSLAEEPEVKIYSVFGRAATRVDSNDLTFSQLYKKQRPVRVKKLKDLIDFLPLILENNRPFYLN